MKNVMHLALISLCVLITLISSAQQTDEATIRKLENAEREAILKRDTTMLSELMSTQIVVQNPENTIVGFKKIMSRIKDGKINYSSFERRIDNIAFVGNIAIVMGLETLIPQGDTQNAEKTVKRRFTNIWMKEKDIWKLTARQATIISVN
jgi:ketosteroid isomerase-like protein